MKRMQRLRGTVVKVDEEMVAISDDRSDEEFYFHRSDMAEAEIGQKVDLLISVATNSDGFSRVLMNKKKPKPKAFKMANFSTLVKHMIKTRERLQATLEENPDLSSESKINEQIEFLSRGIRLFS
ncbi:MAG: hypothetical protein ACOYXC_18085 [Candidatus Rifleibacteriota bacterium]